MRQILMLTLLLPLFSIGQDLPKNSEGRIEYASVVTVDSASADQLYSKAKLFIAEMARSAKNITQLNDDATHTILIKGLFPIYYTSLKKEWPYGDVRAMVKVECKDGKFRYSITDLWHEYEKAQYNYSGGPLESDKPACGTLLMTKKVWENVKENADKEIRSYIDSLKNAMVSKKNTDW
jgi:hypothetical protein